MYQFSCQDFNVDYRNGDVIPPIAKEDGLMRIGNKYVGVVSLINHGEKTTIARKTKVNPKNIDPNSKIEDKLSIDVGFMYELGFALPFDHIVNTSFIILSKEKMNTNLWFATISDNFLASLGWTASKIN